MRTVIAMSKAGQYQKVMENQPSLAWRSLYSLSYKSTLCQIWLAASLNILCV
jgi:hypothetical protein